MMAVYSLSDLTRLAGRVYGAGSYATYYGVPPYSGVRVTGPDRVTVMAVYEAPDWNSAVSKAATHLLGMPTFGDVRRSDMPMPTSVNSDADVPGVEGSSREMQIQYDNTPVGQRVTSDELGEFQAEARRVYGDDAIAHVQQDRYGNLQASVMRGEHAVIEWRGGTLREAVDGAIVSLRERQSLDGVNKTSGADVLRHKETATVTTSNAPKSSIKETMTADATDAAWRVAGSQLTKTVRDPLVAMLSRNLAPGDDVVRARIASFLETELGVGLLAGMLSAGLSAMPAPAGSPAETINARLSRELRVKSMATVGDALADVLAGPLREVVATYLRGVPEAISGLPESTRITDVAFDPSTTAATR